MTHDKLGGNAGAAVFAALRESNNYREALEPAQKM
jgi:hypothetical protein